MMHLAGKNVIVVGLGVTGLSCVRYLLEKGANVSALDTRSALKHELNISVTLGPIELDALLMADLVVLSPGISRREPAIANALVKGIQVIGDIELFAQANCKPVLAITGSNGKSTVTMLLAQMLAQDSMKYVVGGNVGTPALELLDDEYDWVVLELSSFQLESTFSLKPYAATVLNISEDHIDMHGSLQAYRAAKMHIYRGAVHSLANRDDPQTWNAETAPDLTFGLSESPVGVGYDEPNQCITLDGRPLFSIRGTLLTGAHNILNIQAAAGLAHFAGVSTEAMRLACLEFKGLPHRCQLVAEKQGVRWINDSKATNVGACVAAVEGIAGNTAGRLILIAGGDGKGADFSPLREVLHRYVALVITLGKDGHKIAALGTTSKHVNSLTEAVNHAASVTKAGDVVLLSPACASLDMFDNYMHRGDVFQQAVEELAA